MTDLQNGNQQGNEKPASDSWMRILCAIAFLIVALLALPPLPPLLGTVVAALALLAALWLLGLLSAPPPDWRHRIANWREGPLRWGKTWVWAAILAAVLLFARPPLPPHLRFTAVVIGALALVGALGWFPELRATLRRWLGGPQN